MGAFLQCFRLNVNNLVGMVGDFLNVPATFLPLMHLTAALAFVRDSEVALVQLFAVEPPFRRAARVRWRARVNL